VNIIRPITITDAILTSNNVTEADYAAWSAATAYIVGDRYMLVAADVHKVYEALIAGTNKPIATNPTYWALVGATNRWKMLDTSVSSQTTNANSIAYSFTLTSRADSVALMNISAASATITQTTTDGLTYNKTTSLLSTSGINDWFSYFFEPITRITDFAITDMPFYANAVVSVTLTDTGNTVACGACVLGLNKEIGSTQYGAKVGIQDYSIKTKDAYGTYSITQRAYNKKADFSVWVEGGLVDSLQAMLALYRAQPIVYIGSSSYGATMLLGYYKDFSIDLQYPTVSLLNIQLEGLT
jgi:hypothetical protein